VSEITVRRENTKYRATIRSLIVENFSTTYSTGDLEADLVEHPHIAACALAPLSVSPPIQRRGIGSMLVEQSLSACHGANYKVAFVQGNSAYYVRFVFAPVGQFNLRTVFLSEYDMTLPIDDGALDAVSGLVDYPTPWDPLRTE